MHTHAPDAEKEADFLRCFFSPPPTPPTPPLVLCVPSPYTAALQPPDSLSTSRSQLYDDTEGSPEGTGLERSAPSPTQHGPERR